MLALEEKVRTVVLLEPKIALDAGKVSEIINLFTQQYLEVKAQKEVYLTEADANNFFNYLSDAKRKETVERITQGLSQVMVLEHLDGEVIERTQSFIEETLTPNYAPDGGIYCSQGAWMCMRDIEFFFPHLDSLPTERTLALVKVDGMEKGPALMEVIESEALAAGLIVLGTREVKAPTQEEVDVLIKDLADASAAREVGEFLKKGFIAMCLEGRGAVGKWRLLCGPENVGEAKTCAPASLRAQFGTDSASNALHASASMAAAEKELKTIFPDGTLQLQRTLCVVKPDAMSSLLQIRMEIEAAGFTVLKEKHTTLTEDRAKDFYRDYKGMPFYNSMIKEACAGPCCILVLCRLEAVAVWQQVMGPESVKDAKRLRPTSIRARFGRDGQRNAVHGSSNAKAAMREVRFFFPELGVDPLPSDDEVRDFLFRKSAGASMDLKSLSDGDEADFTVDPTLQQLISKGLMALCQVQPKGIAAVKWFSRWLTENNPNKVQEDTGLAFDPPDRTKRFVEYGVNQDGMPFAVEAPPKAPKKPIVDVDVSQETEETRPMDLSTPPFVVLVASDPEAGHDLPCIKLAEQFNLVHLSAASLKKEEIAAETPLGMELKKDGDKVSDMTMLKLLKKSMVKFQDTNRFLLDGFPATVDQAKSFEQEIGEMAFVLSFDGTKRSEEQDAIGKYYSPIGKFRSVKVPEGASADGLFAEAKRFFSCRFLYLLGPPGAPVAQVGDCLEEKYGYASINLTLLLQAYAASGEKDADKVQQALAKGKAVDASIACPLILSEIYRDMALGHQNFVLCDFPQNLQQAQFLEHRVPCVTRPLLLDFSRPDAEDLVATMPNVGQAEEARTTAFFGDAMQDLMKKLTGLERIPCNLASLDGMGQAVGASTPEELQAQLVDATWESVNAKVSPGLTIVLGLPCSGTEALARKLASLTPNTQAVDCNLLLDRELERRTDIGLKMHNMLTRGQVVPLSTTLELLKDIVNVTCSDSLVIENCPMYVDQVEYIAKEFRIDRVFYIAGNDKAVDSWKGAFLNSSDDKARDEKIFDERVDRLAPIVTYFSRLGKLDRLDVDATPDEEKLTDMLSKATLPKFAVVSGLADISKVVEQLGAAYGAPVLTSEKLQEWAKSKLGKPVDPGDAAGMASVLKQYTGAESKPLFVLDRYPKSPDDAKKLIENFGTPAVVVDVDVNLDDDDNADLKTELVTAIKDARGIEDDAEAEELLNKDKQTKDDMLQVFQEKCQGSLLKVKHAANPKEQQEIVAKIQRRLLPKVHIVAVPSGEMAFSSLVADSICGKMDDDRPPAKYTVIDAMELCRPGGHSPDLEDRLCKAAFSTKEPDQLSSTLWVDLFSEAFAKSANPMGTFLVINFPTPCSLKSSPTIRDQFSMLESISTLAAIIKERTPMTQDQYSNFCTPSADKYDEYCSFNEAVQLQAQVQFENLLCEVDISSANGAVEAAQAYAAAFLRHINASGSGSAANEGS